MSFREHYINESGNTDLVPKQEHSFFEDLNLENEAMKKAFRIMRGIDIQDFSKESIRTVTNYAQNKMGDLENNLWVLQTLEGSDQEEVKKCIVVLSDFLEDVFPKLESILYFFSGSEDTKLEKLGYLKTELEGIRNTGRISGDLNEFVQKLKISLQTIESCEISDFGKIEERYKNTVNEARLLLDKNNEGKMTKIDMQELIEKIKLITNLLKIFSINEHIEKYVTPMINKYENLSRELKNLLEKDGGDLRFALERILNRVTI